MIDLHCHILPGVDDGSPDMETSLGLAKVAVEQGITHMLLTPHHMDGEYLNHKADVITKTKAFQEALDQNNIQLTVFPGQEVHITGELIQAIERDDILFADENNRYLMLELPHNEVPPDSQDYGYVKETPKKGWQHFNFLGELKKIFHIPIVWTTDVNVATYGEYKMGAATNKSSALYLTVGTGIGGGLIYKNNVFQNWNHPEMGHIMVSPMHKDKYTGNCPYHKSCLEGMASGPALEARANQKALAIPKDDPLWNLEAFYLAQAAMTYTLLYAPEIIIFGGGVSNQEQLYPLIRKSFSKQLNHYVDTPKLNKYLVHAKLGDDAGITGALLLAQNK